MLTRTTLLIAGLTSCVAPLSMAQTPATPKLAASASTVAAAPAPADASSTPTKDKHHYMHHNKKAQPVSPSASSAK